MFHDDDSPRMRLTVGTWVAIVLISIAIPLSTIAVISWLVGRDLLWVPKLREIVAESSASMTAAMLADVHRSSADLRETERNLKAQIDDLRQEQDQTRLKMATYEGVMKERQQLKRQLDSLVATVRAKTTVTTTFSSTTTTLHGLVCPAWVPWCP